MNRFIYCISGLGADDKIFSNIRIRGYELVHLPWLKPHRDETIEAYARRMGEPIRHPNPVLLGVSFGGMVAIEIARLRHVQQLILISSVKSTGEIPRWMRLAGKWQLNKMLPTRSYSFTEKIDNKRLGVSNEEERQMVTAYRQNADRDYLEWAIGQVLNWKNHWTPPGTIHIHGDKDKIFPLKKIHPTHVVKGGTHFIVYNRAEEISRVLEKELP